jgi:hypothetical protein
MMNMANARPNAESPKYRISPSRAMNGRWDDGDDHVLQDHLL